MDSVQHRRDVRYSLIMTSQHDKPKRWRPRISVRTLAVVVTLVCAYFGCWEITKRHGVAAIAYEYELTGNIVAHWGPTGIFHTSAAAPLIVRQDENFSEHLSRRYYFWFFGYVAKLPYERKVKVLLVPVDVDFDFDIDSDVIDILYEEDY